MLPKLVFSKCKIGVTVTVVSSLNDIWLKWCQGLLTDVYKSLLNVPVIQWVVACLTKGKKNLRKGIWEKSLKTKRHRLMTMYLSSLLAERCLKSLCSLFHPSRAYCSFLCLIVAYSFMNHEYKVSPGGLAAFCYKKGNGFGDFKLLDWIKLEDFSKLALLIVDCR